MYINIPPLASLYILNSAFTFIISSKVYPQDHSLSVPGDIPSSFNSCTYFMLYIYLNVFNQCPTYRYWLLSVFCHKVTIYSLRYILLNTYIHNHKENHYILHIFKLKYVCSQFNKVLLFLAHSLYLEINSSGRLLFNHP